MKPSTFALAMIGWSVAAAAIAKEVRNVGDTFDVDVESGDDSAGRFYRGPQLITTTPNNRYEPSDYTSDEIAELLSNFEDAVHGASGSDVTARGIYVNADGKQIKLRLATLAPVTIGTYDRPDWYDAADEILRDINTLDQLYPSFVSLDAFSNNDNRDVGIYEFEYTPVPA
ncbi:hypothetical protein LTR95_017112 [Oleoguttula sp. CCFEE 5521]